MAEDAPKDFFISYTQADQQWAEWIAWHLEAAGYSCVLQAWDFRPGGNFVLGMDKATQQAQRTIAVLSPDYFTSSFSPSEWAEAFRRDPKGKQGLLVPVRVRECDVNGLLEAIIYIDLVGKDEESAKERLLSGIGSGRRKPAQAPGFPSVSFPQVESPSFPGSHLQIKNNRSTPPLRFGAPFPALWNVPRRHSAFFTGRDHLLNDIPEGFTPEPGTGLVRPLAITGLGGLGKTQTAAEYAYRFRQDYQAVLWVRAETQGNLVEGFSVLADMLKLSPKRQQDRESLISIVHEWFRTETDWLLILDNADELTVVDPFLPKAARGHILFTTRTSALSNFAQPLPLKPLEPEDGALCILRRASYLKGNESLRDASSVSVQAALTLSQLMDGLPLALEQAGAYIDDTGCGVSTYLKTYRQYRPEIQQMHHGDSDYRGPVASAWTIAGMMVEQNNPAAAELLRFCAFLASDAIPDEIMTKGASALGPVLGPVAENTVTFDSTIRVLRTYSLLNRDVDHDTDISKLSIHPIIQDIIKDDMDPPTQQLWAERAVQAVALALPSVGWQSIQSHAQRCVQLIKQWQMTFREAEQLQQYVQKRNETL